MLQQKNTQVFVALSIAILKALNNLLCIDDFLPISKHNNLTVNTGCSIGFVIGG